MWFLNSIFFVLKKWQSEELYPLQSLSPSAFRSRHCSYTVIYCKQEIELAHFPVSTLLLSNSESTCAGVNCEKGNQLELFRFHLNLTITLCESEGPKVSLARLCFV